MKTGHIAQAKEVLETASKADPAQEETTLLLGSIKDELSPEPSKHKKKAKKSKKEGSREKERDKNERKACCQEEQQRGDQKALKLLSCLRLEAT